MANEPPRRQPPHTLPRRGALRVEGTRDGEDTAARLSHTPPPPSERPKHHSHGWDQRPLLRRRCAAAMATTSRCLAPPPPTSGDGRVGHTTRWGGSAYGEQRGRGIGPRARATITQSPAEGPTMASLRSPTNMACGLLPYAGRIVSPPRVDVPRGGKPFPPPCAMAHKGAKMFHR